MSDNSNLIRARQARNDEYYTRYEDIEKEFPNYKKYLKGKIIYCNCDGENSNFVKYFKDNFKKYKLKELLYSSGNCFDPENITKLQKCDIVITNPPFSIKNEYLHLLNAYKKKYILLFPGLGKLSYFKKFKLNYGYNAVSRFENTNTIVHCVWVTNFTIGEKHLRNIEYVDKDISTYDKDDRYNIPVINKMNDIPQNYTGFIFLPFTVFEYNCKDFDIISSTSYISHLTINGKEIFKRILAYKKE